MLRRKKARRLRVLESRRAEEIALDSARSGAPISPDATERQSAPTELTVAGDRKFESCSLQRRVRCEPVSRGISPSCVEKPPFAAGVRAGQAARSAETRRTRQHRAYGR